MADSFEVRVVTMPRVYCIVLAAIQMPLLGIGVPALRSEVTIEV